MKKMRSNMRSFATAKLQAKTRISLLILILTVIGFSMAACGSGGGGGSRTDTALNGTWNDSHNNSNFVIFNNGNYERATESGRQKRKGTYTTSEGQITMTPTQLYVDDRTVSSFAEYGVTITIGYYTKAQYSAKIDSITNAPPPDEDDEDSMTLEEFKEYLKDSLESVFISQTQTYSVSGNTLTLGGTEYTKG